MTDRRRFDASGAPVGAHYAGVSPSRECEDVIDPARTALVTGAAGFIGSHLSEALAADGWSVRGVDCFTPYYDVAAKRATAATIASADRITFIDADLRTADLGALLDGVGTVFHLAGQPGVRSSWSDGFDAHLQHNVAVTQRVLEAARIAGTQRVVYASSSSVYGNASEYPCVEDVTRPQPFSPYGVTKLAAEHLTRVYAENFGVHTVALRYFTVFGPRQRPDMALRRLIDAGLGGPPFPKHGSGAQRRDFTYVGDVVRATMLAGTDDVAPGTVLNVAGGSDATLDRLIEIVAAAFDGRLPIEELPGQPGDVARTGGSIDRARELLGWEPVVPLEEGVAAQIAWQRALGGA